MASPSFVLIATTKFNEYLMCNKEGREKGRERGGGEKEERGMIGYNCNWNHDGPPKQLEERAHRVHYKKFQIFLGSC